MDLNTIMVILAIVVSFLSGARTGYIKGFRTGSDWVIEELKQRHRGEYINGNKSNGHDKQKTGR